MTNYLKAIVSLVPSAAGGLIWYLQHLTPAQAHNLPGWLWVVVPLSGSALVTLVPNLKLDKRTAAQLEAEGKVLEGVHEPGVKVVQP